MIQFKKIRTTDKAYYQFIENLLIDAFPVEEYREIDQFREYVDTKDAFHCNIILEDDKPVGFITFWDFEDFYYIEHFAIDPNLRNGGYGKKVMEGITKQLNRPIVLEVEHPIEEMAKRRISFYERQGFTLWENDYQQPPYRKGDNFLPMYLMVYGDLSIDKDYNDIRKRIYKDVYGAEE